MTLFDSLTPDHVRTTDPDTSHAAVPSAERLNAQCSLVWAMVRTLTPCTAWEVTERLNRKLLAEHALTGRPPEELHLWQQNVVARRLRDLADRGLIVDSGERREGHYRKPLIVWAVVEAVAA